MAQTHTHSRALSHDFFFLTSLLLSFAKLCCFDSNMDILTRALSLSCFLCDFFFHYFAHSSLPWRVTPLLWVSLCLGGRFWFDIWWGVVGNHAPLFLFFCFVSRIVRRRVYWAVLQIVCFLFFRNSLLFSWETESSKGIALVCLCECVVTVLDTAERSWVCLCVC